MSTQRGEIHSIRRGASSVKRRLARVRPDLRLDAGSRPCEDRRRGAHWRVSWETTRSIPRWRKFAVSYADQADRDYAILVKAIRARQLKPQDTSAA